MLIKSLFFICLLIVTIDSAEKNVTFNVENIWESHKNKGGLCTCDYGWKDGVQEVYDVIKMATSNFHGPSYELANTLVVVFETYLTKIIFFANSNSTVLSSSSTAILIAVSKFNKLGISGFVVTDEFGKISTEVVNDLTAIVSKLSDIIGELTNPVNEALNAFGLAIKRFTNEFLTKNLAGSVTDVDYLPVIKTGQVLMNTVALIAETLLIELKSATKDVYEAVTVLSLIFNFVLIAIQGANSCAQTVWYDQKYVVPEKLGKCSVTLKYVVEELTKSVTAVVLFPLIESLTSYLTSLANLTLYLNTNLENVFGPYEGSAITVKQITTVLSKKVTVPTGGTGTGTLNGLASTLSGILSIRIG